MTLIAPEGSQVKIETFLARELSAWSPPRIARLLAGSCVKVGSRPAKTGRRLWPKEQVEVSFPAPEPLPPVSGPVLPVLFDNESWVVIDKPADLVVDDEPTGARVRMPEGRTVVTLLASQRTDLNVGGFAAPGVAHRLDAGTTGCLALAKDDEGLRNLHRAFEERRLHKEYLCLVEGIPPSQTGELDTPYGKDPSNPRRYSTRVTSARRARLRWSLEHTRGPRAVLRVVLETGRTHQIRAQLADIGLPLVGDVLYGQADAGIGRPALHAVRLRLEGPGGFDVSAPVPLDFEAVSVAP